MGLPAFHGLPGGCIFRCRLGFRDGAIPLVGTDVRGGKASRDQAREEAEGVQVDPGGHSYVVERFSSIDRSFVGYIRPRRRVRYPARLSSIYLARLP